MLLNELKEKTHPGREATGPRRFSTYAPVILGGIPQWVEVRGESPANPLLLYLHGGPGASMKACRHLFQTPWERHFTVAQWDQRGTGRTFRGTGAAIRPTMSFERMLADAEELIDHLLARFGQRQLILLGHSWGSAMGLALIRRVPAKISAYVGVGQVVNMHRNEELGYAHVLARARAARHRVAVKALEAIGPAPHLGAWPAVRRRLAVQRFWLHRFGGCMMGSTSAWPLFRPILRDPDQSPLDWLAHVRGLAFSTDALGEEFLAFDAERWGLDAAVPVAFLLGRHDINTPSELAAEYWERLRAPRKELVWLEHSAHDGPLAEPERFLSELLRVTSQSTVGR